MAPPSPLPALAVPSRRQGVLAGGIALLLTLAAYHNSFSGPFLGDDTTALPQNPTIRHLWPILAPLSPPAATTVSGRPVLNFSFALNYAMSGSQTWSYHAVNLAIHFCAGLALFGVVRRTLLQPVLRDRFREKAFAVAAVSALLWMLHPVQTECVTYIVQRAESLMGLLYLVTLYCFIRGAEAEGPRRRRWQAGAFLACLLAMGTKEVAVTAPLMVGLYDRTFVSGSFGASWRRHRWLLISLALTWLVFVPLIAAGLKRDPTSGFGNGVPFLEYLRTQPHAIAHYLRIAFWPRSLLVYYFEPGGPRNFAHATVLPYALLVAPLLGGTVFALWRAPVAGFIGAWFFGILAPTSLVPGALDTMADRRLYLSLAAIIVPLVAGTIALTGQRCLPAFLALAVGLGLASERRNRIYGSDYALCLDQAAARPDDPVAHYNLGCAWKGLGKFDEAIEEFRLALKGKPDYVEALSNLGAVLVASGRPTDAVDDLARALHLAPRHLSARVNLGIALANTGRWPEAIGQYREVLRLKPDLPEAHYLLGVALGQTGMTSDSISEFEQALQFEPGLASARYQLAASLVRAGRIGEAQVQFDAWQRLNRSAPAGR